MRFLPICAVRRSISLLAQGTSRPGWHSKKRPCIPKHNKTADMELSISAVFRNGSLKRKKKWPLIAEIPTTKGHFCSLLISNIFCDPLFLLSTLCFCLTALKHIFWFLRENNPVFGVMLTWKGRRGTWFVPVDASYDLFYTTHIYIGATYCRSGFTHT